MIPGNRPEDIAEEEFWATLEKKFAEQNEGNSDLFWNWMNENQALSDAVMEYATIARDLGYERGFAEGRQEEQMAQAMKEEEQD
jgi:hypothetical protein